MDFTTSLLERHAAKVEGLELGQIKRLIKIYRVARNSIMSQLLSIPSDTFTEAKLGTALERINISLTLLERAVRGETEFGFDIMSDQGIEDSVKEINKFEKHFNGINQAVPFQQILDSTDPANILLNKYDSSIAAYNESLRNGIQGFLTQSLVQNKPWTQTVNEMGMQLNLQEWKLARIVRTELHNIYNVSKNNGLLEIRDQYLPDLKKTLYHPMDSRTGEDSKQMAKQNKVVDIDKPFVFIVDGKKQTFYTPPNRPNDRAILIPYRESYETVSGNSE